MNFRMNQPLSSGNVSTLNPTHFLIIIKKKSLGSFEFHLMVFKENKKNKLC